MTPTATTTSAVATVCTNCCSDDRLLLHCLRLRGVYRKLCTSCVLKLHPTSFCPTCFSLHDVAATAATATATTTTTTTTKTLTCFKCSSISHASCVPPNAPRSPFLCFLCTNPNFKFFDFRKPGSGATEGGDEKDNRVIPPQTLDEKSARVLVAAARIAAMSMNRAATSARAEADKKVREAALARKRAKEAIDYVTSLSARVVAVGGVKRRESEVSGAGGAVKTPIVPLRLEKNGGIGRVNMNNVGPPVGVGVNTPEVKNVGVTNSNNGPVGTGGGGGGGGSNLQSNGNNGGNSNNHVGVSFGVVSGGSDKKDGILPQVE